MYYVQHELENTIMRGSDHFVRSLSVVRESQMSADQQSSLLWPSESPSQSEHAVIGLYILLAGLSLGKNVNL